MAKKRRVPAQKRRARGTGSIFLDKRRNQFVARVPVGKYPSGATKYREVRAATQAEVVAKMKTVAPPGPDITVGEWADRWLAGLRVRPSTHDVYKIAVEKRIKPAFGALRLADLTTWHIEAAAADWSDPRAEDRLAPASLTAALAKVSSCLQAAVRAKLIPQNPTSHVRRPRRHKAKLDLFSPAELRQIIDLASTRPSWYPFALCAAVGCRIGEALVLRPGDYDRAAGVLSISRTYTRHGDGPPKSEYSARDVRVPAVVRPVIEAGWPRTHYATAAARWKVMLKGAGLRFRNLHQLRHSVATHAIAAQVPLSNVARDLGDTEDTIVRVYLHPTPGKDVCEAMEELLGGSKVAPAAEVGRKAGRNAAG